MESSYVSALREWHTKFGVPILDSPQEPPEDRKKLRLELIREEFRELIEASIRGDVVAYADGIADLLYVVHGAALEWGIPADAVFSEVHRSNMSKIWDDGSVHYREDGKVLKPPTYSPANIKGVLEGLDGGAPCSAGTAS